MSLRSGAICLAAGLLFGGSCLRTVANEPQNKPAPKGGSQPKRKAPAQPLDPFERPEGSIIGQSARFYVWYDKGGWHVRTTAINLRRFHGTIRVKGAQIASCLSVGLRHDQKQHDTWHVNENRDELTFDFTTGKKSDGIDFKVDGEGELEFELTVEGEKRPRTVFIGRKQQHPPAIPFELPAAPTKPTEAGGACLLVWVKTNGAV